MRTKYFFLLLVTLALPTHAEILSRIGIIIPVPTESAWLKTQIHQTQTVRKGGVNFILGTVANQPIVLTNSSIGKVNATITATQMINYFHPRMILVAGSSGSINTTLNNNDVIIGKTVVDVDLGSLTPQGEIYPHPQELFNPNRKAKLPLMFYADPKLLAVAKPLLSKQVQFGSIATGDNLPDPAIEVEKLKQAHFDVAEMEGAAIMHVCWFYHTPCLVFRGVSNIADHEFSSQQVGSAGTATAKVLVNYLKLLS